MQTLNLPGQEADRLLELQRAYEVPLNNQVYLMEAGAVYRQSDNEEGQAQRPVLLGPVI